MQLLCSNDSPSVAARRLSNSVLCSLVAQWEIVMVKNLSLKCKQKTARSSNTDREIKLLKTFLKLNNMASLWLSTLPKFLKRLPAKAIVFFLFFFRQRLFRGKFVSELWAFRKFHFNSGIESCPAALFRIVKNFWQIA